MSIVEIISIFTVGLSIIIMLVKIDRSIRQIRDAQLDVFHQRSRKKGANFSNHAVLLDENDSLADPSDYVDRSGDNQRQG